MRSPLISTRTGSGLRKSEWSRKKTAVRPEDRERRPSDGQAHEPRIGGVDDPPTLDLSCSNLELGLLLAVDEANVALSPRVMLVRISKRRDLAVFVELQIEIGRAHV